MSRHYSSRSYGGYGSSRRRTGADRFGILTFFLLLISTMMIPGYVTLIPNFAIMVKLKLLNSHWALILRSALSGSATSIFLFRQFFLRKPVLCSQLQDNIFRFHI